eukprot:9453735-Pyramimonas_sp.AAC.1
MEPKGRQRGSAQMSSTAIAHERPIQFAPNSSTPFACERTVWASRRSLNFDRTTLLMPSYSDRAQRTETRAIWLPPSPPGLGPWGPGAPARGELPELRPAAATANGLDRSEKNGRAESPNATDSLHR